MSHVDPSPPQTPALPAEPRTPPRFTRLSILMPVFNEAPTIRRCVARVLNAPLPSGLGREIVAVDDASTDGTGDLLAQLAQESPEIRVFRQARNRGKGAALRRAIAEMRGDLAVCQDGDLEYDPRDFVRLLAPILEGKADVVYGSRFTGTERKVLYFWHTVGNRCLTLLANMLNDLNLTDMETCYKAFAAERLRAIPLQSNRFGIEPELTAKVALNRLRIYEVPINYNGRTYEEGKKIHWRDGVAAFWWIVRYRFSSHYADPGRMALDALEQAPRFNRWMYDSIKPYLGHRLVELGCGRGNLTRHLRHHGELLAVDYRADYLTELREKWGYLDNLRLDLLDLTAPVYEPVRHFGPDTVVCLNVLEHIEDDRAVLRRLREALPPKARLVFLVPYNPALTSEFDRQVGHWRRYRKGELEAKMREAGFQVVRQFFFNKVGVLAWWVANTLGGQKTLTPWQLRLYNLLTPLFRVLDRLLPTSGLSTIVVAQNPDAATPSPTGNRSPG